MLARVVRRCAVALVLLVLAAPVEAQYFGQNKVQYEDFDFRVVRTDHFDIYFYPEERVAAGHAARLAERWYARLSRIFDHELTGRQPLILYASQPHFRQTNATFGDVGEGTGGFTEALKRRIVMPIGGSLSELDHVLGHELVHAFQYDMTGTVRGGGAGGIPGAARLPLWFIEGMAEYLSIGPESPLTSMWVRGAMGIDRLPTFRDLDDPRFFPYRYGHALLAYLGGQRGDEIIGVLLREASRRRSVEFAMEAVLRMPADTVVARWHAATRDAFEPVEAATQPADSVGERLIAAKGDEIRYNVAPSLSPDGSQVMFLSDRDLFSIDLFLADARTGEIKRRITQTAVDPHFSSLQFIESAGAWDPSGRRFVFAGLAGANPVLRIIDVERGRAEREIAFENLAEIFNPSWSPDGRSIVFSGIAGGLTDLFIVDLETGQLQQLTDDPFSDLDPAWSPDGRTIAFATDRFSTTLDDLHTGDPRLALLDVATRSITPLGGDEHGKQINPRWGPDGSLFFLGNPNGITNIFRRDAAASATVQLTNLFVGVAGITELSPALSVASGTGRMAFSAFRDNGYDLYTSDSLAMAPGVPVTPPPAAVAMMLPPQERSGSLVLSVLRDDETGLPPASEDLAVTPYQSGLSLDFVGQPSLVAGGDQFGTFVGGGVAFYFSDMLGNRNLATALQVNGSIKDITAQVAYTNLSGRWNLGGVAQQVVYRTGAFAQGVGTVDGQPAFIEQQLLERQTSRQVAGLVAYPFSRVRRVEFTLGANQISFDTELRTRAFSQDGRQLLDETEDLDNRDPIYLGQATAAYVYDNSFFGATAPILGQRYRFDVSPNVGTLTWVNVLADYRRYVLPVRPFTFAVRFMHFGRYGKDGEDNRLQPLFIGYPSLVHGYDFGSFSGSECDPTPADPNACPVFDQLLGSRLAVGNVELRFPLFGALGIGSGYYGVFPLDFVVFGDAGVAWTSEEEPKALFGGTREPVFSAGGALRVNLFGFAIFELARVRAFDRPERRWLWQFSLQPGF